MAVDFYSNKEEKPTLAGVRVRARKRNIVVPLDPGSFANEVIQILQDNAKEDAPLQENLDAGIKVLENSRMDFQRYGDTLFEILFAGGRMAAGANLDNSGKKVDFNLLACEATSESIFPYIKAFQSLVRRRPFLVKKLENVLIKLLKSLEFFEQDGRKKLAIATALIYAPDMKIGILPENVLNALNSDRLVQSGSVMEFITAFFKEYLSKNSLDELVAILTKAKVTNRLYEFFPPQIRNIHDFSEHFRQEGMEDFLKWHTHRAIEVKVQELKGALTERMGLEDSDENLIDFIKEKAQEGELPDNEILKVLWIVLMGTMNMAGKNQQQLVQVIKNLVEGHKDLLAAFCTTAKLEASLLVTIQVHCYEDNKLLKIFSDIVRLMYDVDIVGEDTILFWYRKGSHSKGRNVFLKDIEPFIKWLEEAEEEDEGEEDDDDDDEAE